MMAPGLAGFALLAIGLAGLPSVRADSGSPGRAPVRITLEARTDGGSDFQRFHAALDSLAPMGGEIRLGAGVFDLTGDGGPLDCQGCRNVVLRGSGPGTVIKSDPGPVGRGSVFRFVDSDSLIIRDLRMEGSFLPERDWGGNAVYHGGLLFSSSTNVTVQACGFSGFYTGAVLFQSGSSAFTVSGCDFDRVSYKMKGDFGAVSIESGSHHGIISGNTFTRMTHSAISAYGSHHLDVSRNRATFIAGSKYTMGFFALHGISASAVYRNRFLGAHNEAIMLEGGEAGVFGIRVEGNDLAGRFAGICINEARNPCSGPQSHGNRLIGNRISAPETGKTSHGILINHGRATRISGNEISGAVCGINIQSCSSESEIDSNSISSVETGINLTGGGKIETNRFRKAGVGLKVPARDGVRIFGNAFSEVRQRQRALE